MKKLLSALLLLSLCFVMTACDLSHIGTDVGEELPDIELEPVGDVYRTVYDKRDPFDFNVKASNIYGDTEYEWRITLWDNFGLEQNCGWSDMYWSEPSSDSAFRPDFYMMGIPKGALFRVQCIVRDVTEAGESRSASLYYYVYLSDKKDPSQGSTPFGIVPEDGDKVYLKGYELGDHVYLKVRPENAKGSVTYEWYSVTLGDAAYGDEYDDNARVVYEEFFDGKDTVVRYEPSGDTLKVLVENRDGIDAYLCVASDGSRRAYQVFLVIPEACEDDALPEKNNGVEGNGVWPDEVKGHFDF